MDATTSNKLIAHVTHLVDEMEKISDLDIIDYDVGWYHAVRGLLTNWLRELELTDEENEEVEQS